MAEWEGFTEEDLKKLQTNPRTGNVGSKPKIVKPVTKKRATPVSNASRLKAKPPAKKQEASVVERDVSDAALLSRPKSVVVRSKSVADPLNPSDVKPSSGQSDCIFDEETIQKKEKLKLEDVHQRQKQMEERNKRKKNMLVKEIAQRKKKAFAESSKLVKIQQELAKLDELLTLDVSILRDKIDDACVEFSNAQKRFNKAEAEYIAAKMELHSKTTMKEDLTEHLFNLIQVNEERKARKLEELMHKLDVEEAELEAKEETKAREAKQSETTPVPASTEEPPPPSPTLNADNLHGGNASNT